MKPSLSLLLGMSLLSGCVLPQQELPAHDPIAGESLGLSGPAYAEPVEHWWRTFGDPQLDRLMTDALRDSPTLAQALARLRAAQAQLKVTNGGNDPHFAIDADESYQRFSEHYYYPPPYGGGRYWIGQGMVDMGWALDFWGRQAALIQQANAQVGATHLEIEAAQFALTGAVAQAYLDLQRSWDLLEIADRTSEQRQELLRLTQRRVNVGLDTQIELHAAEVSAAQARAARLHAEGQRDLAVHRLAVLAGYGADRYRQIVRPHLESTTRMDLPQELPIDLLAHRPDVMAARARVAAADAGRKAARAAFYPEINLRAFVGVQAIGLAELAKSGSLAYGVGPTLHIPLFDSRLLRSQYTRATADLDSAIATYNETVLNAVRQTADQLTLHESLKKQIAEVQHALQAAESGYALARKRYAAGLITQLAVLNAELQLLKARSEYVAANTDLIISRINLRLTLGGPLDAPKTTS